jgi:hypothetical protein
MQLNQSATPPKQKVVALDFDDIGSLLHGTIENHSFDNHIASQWVETVDPTLMDTSLTAQLEGIFTLTTPHPSTYQTFPNNKATRLLEP